MKNIENTKIDEVLEELYALRDENHELKVDNEFLEKQNKALKLRCGKYCIQVSELETENRDMKLAQKLIGEADNEKLILENKELKRQLDEATDENLKRIEESNRLFCELQDIKHMGVWEFANKYCSDEQNAEAGKQLARSLLGKPMTEEELAIEAAENAHVPYVGDDF